jgi:hypothetical protein
MTRTAFRLFEFFAFGVISFLSFSHSEASTTKVDVDLIEGSSDVCQRDIHLLLSSKTVFNHPDLKNEASNAFSVCRESNFYPNACLTDITKFERICQALGGQMISERMTVSCSDSSSEAGDDEHFVVGNAPNCVPKSCELNKFKKDLSFMYAESAEDHLNQSKTTGKKCTVAPDFCMHDTFHLLGTLDVFHHPLLIEGLGHAFNSCEFNTNGAFKSDCLMATEYFEDACEEMGGQMTTHHLEMKCYNNGGSAIQFFNSPNCIAKSCDVSMPHDRNFIDSYYTISLEAATDYWSNNDSFLRSSVNYHERHPSRSYYSSRYRWVPRNPGVCTVSSKMISLPKLLLPAAPIKEQHIASERNINSSRSIVLVTTTALLVCFAVGSVFLAIFFHRQQNTKPPAVLRRIVARPMSGNEREIHSAQQEQESERMV